MGSVTVHTHAKLNLSLLVSKKRKDGYHPIFSVFQTISLHDSLTIVPIQEKKLRITCNNPAVPKDKRNILFSIYNKYSEILSSGFNIHIEKEIPLYAGLGGGSTNAAGFLLYLNKFYLKFNKTKIKNDAIKFGADVPFFLEGGTALVEGIGEKLSPMKTLDNKTYLIITPNIYCETKKIYSLFDTYNTPLHSQKLKENIIQTHIGVNDLKKVVMEQNTQFLEIEKTLKKHLNNDTVFMSGSGSTLFISIKDQRQASLIIKDLQSTFDDIYLKIVRPIDGKAVIFSKKETL